MFLWIKPRNESATASHFWSSKTSISCFLFSSSGRDVPSTATAGQFPSRTHQQEQPGTRTSERVHSFLRTCFRIIRPGLALPTQRTAMKKAFCQPSMVCCPLSIFHGLTSLSPSLSHLPRRLVGDLPPGSRGESAVVDSFPDFPPKWQPPLGCRPWLLLSLFASIPCALEQVPWESLPIYAPPSCTSLAIPTEAHIARTTINRPGWISFLHHLTYRQFRLWAQIPEHNLPIPLSAPFTTQMLRHKFNHLLGAPESAVIHNPFGRHPVALSSPSRRRCSRRYL